MQFLLKVIRHIYLWKSGVIAEKLEIFHSLHDLMFVNICSFHNSPTIFCKSHEWFNPSKFYSSVILHKSKIYRLVFIFDDEYFDWLFPRMEVSAIKTSFWFPSNILDKNVYNNLLWVWRQTRKAIICIINILMCPNGNDKMRN